MKRICVTIGIVFFIFLTFNLVDYLFKTKREKVIDQCIIHGNNFSIRILAISEEGVIMPVPGTYYSYEYRSPSENNWHRITTFRHDDQISAPCNQISYLDDSIAYFFIGWIYGVTSDGGKTWFLWDAEKDLEGWKPANYTFIQKIELNKNGKGTMYLKPIRFYSDRLVTNDFGKSWKVSE